MRPFRGSADPCTTVARRDGVNRSSGPSPSRRPQRGAGRCSWPFATSATRREAGLAPGINHMPLPDFLVRFQVRNGLGAMPAFGPDQISDAELDALVTYLNELRGAAPAPQPAA
jgi:hypothetical protein